MTPHADHPSRQPAQPIDPHWDDAASRGDASARWAVWAEPDWSDGVRRCIEQLAPLEPIFTTHGARVLDVGCGVGRLLVPLAERYPDVNFIGLDPSLQMLRHVPLDRTHGNVRCVLGDVASLPDLAPLDGLYSVVTLQHLPSTAQAAYIAALARVLRPGGIGRLQFVTHGGVGPLSHPTPPDVMASWCRAAGLEVVDLDEGGVFDEWGWVTATALS